MAMRLGGWWRLWILVSAVYGCAVIAYSWLTWPQVANVTHEPSFLLQMSSEAKAILERAPAKTLAQLEGALVAADRAGATEDARAIAKEIARRRASPWEGDSIVLEMPNGYEFHVSGDTTKEHSTLVGRDYVRVLQAVVADRRLAAIGFALLLWLVPSAVVCVFGLAVAWVYRGFAVNRREP